MKKILVKDNIGNRLNKGRGLNNIGGAHLHHVSIAIYACLFIERSYHLLGAAHKAYIAYDSTVIDSSIIESYLVY